MTKLDCNVKNCLHNSDNHCCKQAIIVDGSKAKDCCDTCCGSFDENKDGASHNLFKTPESRLEVDCEAVNCVYNRDRHCEAEHIGIAGEKGRILQGMDADVIVLDGNPLEAIGNIRKIRFVFQGKQYWSNEMLQGFLKEAGRLKQEEIEIITTREGKPLF